MTVTIPRATVPTDAMLPRPFRLRRRFQETADTFTLEFEAADAGPPMRFEPGQFTMVYAFGVGEVPLSISGDPERPETLVHTVREVGAVTSAICNLELGDTVGVRGPFGTSWPDASGKDLVIVAGGIGIAPVMPAMHRAVAKRWDYSCLGIAYGARAPRELLFLDELDKWARYDDVNVQITVDRADSAWRGDVGFVTPLVRRLRCAAGETVALVVGPEVMMRVVARTLTERGVRPEDVYVSLERNMKCGIGLCGHCQFGEDFVCRTGPVFRYADVADRLWLGAR